MNNNKYVVGQQFLLNEDTWVEELEEVIKEDTLFTIVEYDNSEGYKIYFEGHGSEESNFIRVEEEEIEEMRKSAMYEY